MGGITGKRSGGGRMLQERPQLIVGAKSLVGLEGMGPRAQARRLAEMDSWSVHPL